MLQNIGDFKMNRREFLKTTGVAGSTIATGISLPAAAQNTVFVNSETILVENDPNKLYHYKFVSEQEYKRIQQSDSPTHANTIYLVSLQ